MMKYNLKGYTSYNNGKKKLDINGIVEIENLQNFIYNEFKKIEFNAFQAFGLASVELIKKDDYNFIVDIKPAITLYKTIQKHYNFKKI